MDNIGNVIKKLKKYNSKDVFYCKPINYLCFRNNCSEMDFEKDLLSGKNLKVINPHKRNGELRHGLYFIYNRRKGRVYIVKFGNLLKVVTIYPIGTKTLNRYNKRRFKKKRFLRIL
jgi:hypothetical protein